MVTVTATNCSNSNSSSSTIIVLNIFNKLVLAGLREATYIFEVIFQDSVM